jgi:hypothetical protein
VNRLWEYINRSQINECGSLGLRPCSFFSGNTHKSDFLAVCAANIDLIKLKYYISLNSHCTCHSKNPPNPTRDESILAPCFAAELRHQSVPGNQTCIWIHFGYFFRKIRLLSINNPHFPQQIALIRRCPNAWSRRQIELWNNDDHNIPFARLSSTKKQPKFSRNALEIETTIT